MSIHVYTVAREPILSVQKSILLGNNFNNLHLILDNSYMQFAIIIKTMKLILSNQKMSFYSADEIPSYLIQAYPKNINFNKGVFPHLNDIWDKVFKCGPRKII